MQHHAPSHHPADLPASAFGFQPLILPRCRPRNSSSTCAQQPAAGAVREIAEETGVVAVAERIISVSALPLMACPNGDQVHWLDVAFRCRAQSGEARVNDDESIDVGWFAIDELPVIQARQLNCIQDGLAPDHAARFERA
jgi:8-oxo-dGTP pyrophosphatase MutT (NUDIX family)